MRGTLQVPNALIHPYTKGIYKYPMRGCRLGNPSGFCLRNLVSESPQSVQYVLSMIGRCKMQCEWEAPAMAANPVRLFSHRG